MVRQNIRFGRIRGIPLGGQRCLLVNREDKTIGLIILHRINEVPRDKWPTTLVGQVLFPVEKMKRIRAEKELWAALDRWITTGSSSCG
jgi:hypothetical protein